MFEYRNNNSECIPTEESKFDNCYFDKMIIDYLNWICPEKNQEIE